MQGTSKADMWLMLHSKYFKPEHMHHIQQEISHIPEERMGMLLTLQFHDPTTILIFSILLGEFGVDRFMIGDTGLGVGKLLTLGGCLIWWLIDIFLISGRTKDKNFEKLMQALQMQPM